MHRFGRTLSLAFLLLAVSGGPALAQVLPTGDPRELDERAMERHREIRREALRGTNRLLREWTEAWNKDDARRLVRMYTTDAVLLPADGGTQLRGQESIARFLSEALEAASEIRLTLSDFDGASRMAYALGTFSYTSVGREGTNGSTRNLEGEFILVLRKDSGDWRIRSQLFQARD